MGKMHASRARTAAAAAAAHPRDASAQLKLKGSPLVVAVNSYMVERLPARQTAMLRRYGVRRPGQSAYAALRGATTHSRTPRTGVSEREFQASLSKYVDDEELHRTWLAMLDHHKERCGGASVRAWCGLWTRWRA